MRKLGKLFLIIIPVLFTFLKSSLMKIWSCFFCKGVIQKVRSLRAGGRGSLKSEQKRKGGWSNLTFVYVRFFKKNAEIFKMKFYSYSSVFPIDYNGSMKY